jgi:hypothetical protein
MYYPSMIVFPANSLIFITLFLKQTWVPYPHFWGYQNFLPDLLQGLTSMTTNPINQQCWQPIHIFHYLISCLHQCFTNIDFSSQISNERRFYSLRLFARLSSLSLHNYKHEIFSLRGHILIII